MSMSQRTPLRSRSSLGNFLLSGGTGTAAQSSPVPPKPRINMTDLRRPPSRTLRPGSPKAPVTRSRPSSAMAHFGSRPSTPSAVARPEPYTGSITVSIRPNPYSVNPSQNSPWEIQSPAGKITNTTDMASFSFDNVFAPDSSLSNREVYQRSCSNIVDKFLHEGFNGTIFAYGMTGSGKTFSMRGSEQDPGFISLAVDAIFEKIDSDSIDKEHTIQMTYLEIYNEKIIDLLQPSITQSDLKIRDDPVFGTRIMGITTPTIGSKQQLLQLISKGDTNRKTSATDFNTRSSRSHSILQIKLNTINLSNKTETHSTLSLCDLAGSERAVSSLERRKEGSFINKSLLALSTVINKLSMASNTNNADHIPYRDSKLTRLLQPALSGSSLILILCTIHIGSPLSSNQQFTSETYNTLRFAARAKDIMMNVQQNKSSKFGDAESMKLIEELKKTIENQNNEIVMLKMNGYLPEVATGSVGSSDSIVAQKNLKIAQLEAENKLLNEKLEHLTRLTDLQKTETIILKNDTLNDILGSGTESLQIMMANLEEFYKRVNYEMDEQKSYINHLENRVKSSQQQVSLMQNSGSQMQSQRDRDDDEITNKQYEELLKEQEEEIIQLKELLKDKDHLIKSLTKTTKLRRLVDSNIMNSQDQMLADSEGKKPVLAAVSDAVDKENNVLRLFKIGPRPSIEVEVEPRIKFM
ncbi:kinesin-domain-containing protein [Suhomyces tanzawaensis NRRL Y-17324]|uniref:Kinesin-like protein n=1 Tax=Suhomyces tanzawaensis NRRL Y-17324 TaxID=984487 RepID=A0A1E4SSE6_9ASCO|nr:kinesin-domain-containing protein [Suhomyces tanzawaensis NRRL Y-17324]ODV82440.1 kinesin-domain-containing protein [Suhomyces tanzawaensis NRRL Y-17324]